MPDEKLQYELTFKTRAETAPVQALTASVRDLAAEAARTEAIKLGDKLGYLNAGFHDLDAAVTKTTASVKQHTRTQADSDAERARAIQTVRRIKQELAEEEVKLRQLGAANRAAAAGMNVAKGAGQNLSFQLQDIAVQLQSGTKLSTVLAQQLPQLFSGFGAKGAAVAAVASVGMLAYNLLTAKAATDEAKRAAGELADKLRELVGLKAEESASAYGESLERTARRMRDLAEIEGNRLGKLGEIAAAHKRVEEAQDAETEAYLRHYAATTGADVSKDLAALKQRDIQRDATAATEEQTRKVDEQRAAYAEANRQLDELKANAAEWEKQRQDLDTKASDLSKRADVAGRMGRVGEQGDLERELAQVMADAAKLDEILKSVPGRIEELTASAFKQASAIDDAMGTAKANIEAINAEASSKSTQAELDASLEKNRENTRKLVESIEGYKAETPVQKEAIEAINKAAADGVITAEESLKVSRSLETLMSNLSTAQGTNINVLGNLVAMVKKDREEMAALARQVEGMKNGVR